MKHRFLYFAVAAFAMVSCSQDETIDINTGKGISFRTEANAGTRASEISNSNLMDNFQVTALQENGDVYFDKVTFSKQESNTYTSTPAYNWPGTGNLKFHAIYPLITDMPSSTITLTLTEQKLENFTVAETLTNQKDLVYATATGNATNNESSGVNLHFYHQLAQISVKAKGSNNTYIYKVKGVKIAEIPSTANLTAFDQTPTWANWSNKKAFTSTLDTEVILGTDAQSIMLAADGTAMLIPQQLTAWQQSSDKTNNDKGAYLGVLIQINTNQGKRVYPRNNDVDYAYACMPINTKWEAGNHYVYTLDFSNGAGYVDPTTPEPGNPDKPGDPILGGAIKFTVDVETWKTNGNDKEISMD